MKRKLAISIATAAILGSSVITAQANNSFYSTPYKSRNSGSHYQGQHTLTFGLGFPNQSAKGYFTVGEYRMGFGPIYAKYEYGLMDEIGLGARLSYATGGHKLGNVKATNDAFAASFLGYYHFNKLIPVKQLDVYAGAGIGFRHRNYERIHYRNNNDVHITSHNQFNVMPVVVLGAKWYFTKTFGVYAEGGWDGMSQVNLGVALKF